MYQGVPKGSLANTTRFASDDIVSHPDEKVKYIPMKKSFPSREGLFNYIFTHQSCIAEILSE